MSETECTFGRFETISVLPHEIVEYRLDPATKKVTSG